MKNQSKKLVVPDGGWGWMVCFGAMLITLSLRSLDPCFGLLFGDLLKDLEVDTTGTSVITSTYEAVANFSGLLVGPLMKISSFRQISVAASLLSSIGLILTSQATSLTYIIFTYSVFVGLGTGLALTVSFVAMNSYFKKRRTQVVGLSMAGTSLGAMCMPQLVHFLLLRYNFRGTTLILGSINLHAVVGSILFQPVAWHMIPAPEEKDLESTQNGKKSESHALLETTETNGEEKLKEVSVTSNSLHLSSIDLTEDHMKAEKTIQDLQSSNEKRHESGVEKGKAKDSFFAKVVSFFDLNLLKDPIYLNIMLGLSLCMEAELNFKMITPFFLTSIGMSKGEVASSLSLIAFADIVARLIMPTILMKLKIRSKHAFWISNTLVGIVRSTMAELMPGKMLVAFLALNGFLRGIALTNLNLTVAEHCTLDLLPSALGITNVSRGLVVVSFGPVVGYIRDVTNSYQISIHTMTSFIALASIMWTIEYFVLKIRALRINKDKTNECEVS